MKTPLIRLSLVLAALLAGRTWAENAGPRDWSDYPMCDGPFDGNWQTLERYECPAWFRDAKLGMWSIIGPQCVPMQGDWYARNMYRQGSAQYNHHVKTYGHPSRFGYKDLIRLFNPTKLDYDKLVGLYKQAGARYVVILAVHHDNYDLWNSRYHVWNSVNIGPGRDLVGEFRDAARKHGLRFGVTTHLARSYSWLQTSHGADTTGPMKGVPYDGADPFFYSLYHPPFAESAHYPTHPPESWRRLWYLRVKDLIDQYQPDLMYFDGGYPFDDGAEGRRLVSHYYNANMRWHGGRNEAAMCIKNWKAGSGHGDFRQGTCIEDIERGRAGELRQLPWQTDTCIGGWYYRQGTRYKSAGHVVRMLIDIVSKNGNLLLNVPLHPEGWIDRQEQEVLAGIGRWMAVNGEGIYATRPWLDYGEGPTAGGGRAFRETDSPYTPRDFRFTIKGDRTLYAFFMAWPEDGRLVIRSLATGPNIRGRVGRVELLGHDGPLKFTAGPQGLEVKLPDSRPCEHAWALKITGSDLRAFRPVGVGENKR